MKYQIVKCSWNSFNVDIVQYIPKGYKYIDIIDLYGGDVRFLVKKKFLGLF